MNKEHGIDCMRYRKSTHIAGIDVETIVNELGQCVLTIKDAYYAKNVDVSGNKTDGYFLEFEEEVKPMVVNSINRKTIAAVVKLQKSLTSAESRNIGNWIGVQIELSFDESVKMMNKVVGGIRVRSTQLIKQKQPINQERFTKALEAIKSGKFDKDKLVSDFMLTSTQKLTLEGL
jgi:hypothetical protein